jgi:hypothetical protein
MKLSFSLFNYWANWICSPPEVWAHTHETSM